MNRDQTKRAVAALLTGMFGGRGYVRNAGDRWMWQKSTGATEMFDDIEALVERLSESSIIRMGLAEPDSTGTDQLRRIVDRVTTK